MEGKVVTEEEADNRSGWAWCEVYLFIFIFPPKFLASIRTHLTDRLKLQGMRYQYSPKHAYGHGPFGPHFHEVRIQLF